MNTMMTREYMRLLRPEVTMTIDQAGYGVIFDDVVTCDMQI